MPVSTAPPDQQVDALHRPDQTGSLPPSEIIVDDERVTIRVSMLISVFGVLVSVLLLIVGVREYQSGASALWPGVGGLIFLSAVYALVRDVRSLQK
ncbi:MULTISPECIES: hypothetical protein [unclassified Streptomyces]|uniref:hypothetical protein n=1 Tax=unclassified Streptomyces TaxID=2593676 RepID=UPI00364F654A